MVERDDPRRREEKLAELAALGLPYFSKRFEPTVHAADVRRDFDSLEGTEVRIAGRLMRVRQMGKASFAHILDRTGELQLYFKLDFLGAQAYQYFKLLDVGDIVGVVGTVFKTRTGEPTVQVASLELLTKAYRALPDKWHGMADVEARYRRRYLDLISNDESRRLHLLRIATVRALRDYLDSRDFLEVETPTLQPLYGGAAALPFTTHYEALDMTAYLRIATELYLKRMIVAGFERVYEIGKDFRNEGFSRKNSPEFTMLELYQAYADYTDIMDLVEDMFAHTAQSVLGTQEVRFDDQEISLSPPWQRLSLRQALVDHAGVDFVEAGRDGLLQTTRQHGVASDPAATTGQLVEDLFESLVEPHLVQPTFLVDFPIDFPGSLLAERKADNPDLAERFELYIGGMEIANGFTELNDPVDQLERMHEANRLRGESHQEVDRDFILALEHGMPPTGGVGFGVDRLVMILGGIHHIRETILFPLLRPREDQHAEP